METVYAQILMERLAGKGKSARKEMQSLIKTGAFCFFVGAAISCLKFYYGALAQESVVSKRYV